MKRCWGWATLAVAALAVMVSTLGATLDAPRAPTRLAEFFLEGERYFLDPFADGYQAVRLDPPTETALRAARNEEEFQARVYRVVRRGDDFLHFRSASEETDVIVPIASIKRISYRVDREFK